MKIYQLPGISQEKLKKIAVECIDKHNACILSRGRWMKRREKYLAKWDDYVTPTRVGEYKSIANVNIPLTEWMTQVIHSYLLNVCFGVKPPFKVAPREGTDELRIPRLELITQWILEDQANYGRGIREAMGDVLWNTVTEGYGIAKLRWDVVKRNVKSMQVIKPDDLLGELGKIEEMGVQPEDYGDFEQVSKLKTIFSGPVIEPVDNTDFLMPGRATHPSDMNKLPWVAQRLRYTKGQLDMFIQEGAFDPDATNKIIKMTEETSETGYDSHFKELQDKHTGIETKPGGYKFLEVHITEDIDGDGYEEDAVLTIHVDTKEPVRASYLEQMLPTGCGHRPFYYYGFHRRPGRTQSRGLVETLFPLATETNIMHNTSLDWAVWSNAPMGFYRPGSGVADEVIKIEPGTLYPLENPQTDIYFPQRPPAHIWSSQMEGQVISYAERVSFVNDLQLGRVPTPVGGARSTSGMRELTGLFASNMDKIIKQITTTYECMLHDMWCLVTDRMAPGLEMRLGVTGQPSHLTVADISSKLDFKLTANAMNANRAMDAENAQAMVTLLSSRLALELGVVTPTNFYEAVKNVLDKQGEVSVDRFITKPEDAPKAWSVEQEMRAIVQGLMPPIVVNDDHQMKIEVLEMFINSPEFEAGKNANPPLVSAAWDIVYKSVVQQHMRFLEMLQQQEQMANYNGAQAPFQAQGGNNGNTAGGKFGGQGQTPVAPPAGPQPTGAQGAPGVQRPSGNGQAPQG